MKILLIPQGSAGDVHPFLGLGSGLRDRGHDVTVLTNPLFQRETESLGLRFDPLGTIEEFREAISDPKLWDRRDAFRFVIERGILPAAERTFERIRDRYADGETLILAAGIALGARMAEEKLGSALITVQLQPGVFKSVIRPPVFPGAPIGPGSPRWLNRLFFKLAEDHAIAAILDRPFNVIRAGYGLPPIRRVMFEWWNSPEAVLCLFPDWYGLPQPDWPKNVVLAGFPLFDAAHDCEPDPELEAFLGAGDPPIVFTPGSAMIHASAFFREAVRACELLGRRGLFLTRTAGQVPTALPDTIRRFDYAPFSKVLPRAAAIVHHGGVGTSAQGLAAGIPQLITPYAHDQPDNAHRLKSLGVADAIPAGRFRAAAAARKLRRLLESDSVRQNCRRIAGEMNPRQSIAKACEFVESFASARIGGVPTAPHSH